ncbi:hypothetical protein ACWC0A_23075 [Streptomyces scopuliridis]
MHPPLKGVIASSDARQEDHPVTVGIQDVAEGTWDDVLRLIRILDGEPTCFQPLWEAENPHSKPRPRPRDVLTDSDYAALGSWLRPMI